MVVPSDRCDRSGAITAIVVALLVGCRTNLVVCVVLAVSRAPINTFGPSEMVAKVERPFTHMGSSYQGSMWAYCEEFRFGERVLHLMSFASADLRGELVPRPFVSREIEWLLSRQWLGALEEPPSALNESVVVRMYGWPIHALWYGNVGNAGFPGGPWPWTAAGYGAIATSQRHGPARVDTDAAAVGWLGRQQCDVCDGVVGIAGWLEGRATIASADARCVSRVWV